MSILTWITLMWGCWFHQDWRACYTLDHCWNCPTCCAETQPGEK